MGLGYCLAKQCGISLYSRDIGKCVSKTQIIPSWHSDRLKVDHAVICKFILTYSARLEMRDLGSSLVIILHVSSGLTIMASKLMRQILWDMPLVLHGKPL